MMTFPNRLEDGRAIIVDQSKDPVIELIIVLSEVADVRNENDRAQTQDDGEYESTHARVPDTKPPKKSDECKPKGRKQSPCGRAGIGAQTGFNASQICLSAWLLG